MFINMFENDDWNISEDYVSGFFKEDINKSEADIQNRTIEEKSYANISKFEFNPNTYKTNKNVISNEQMISQKHAVLNLFEQNDTERKSAISVVSTAVCHSMNKDSVQTCKNVSGQGNLVFTILESNKPILSEKKENISKFKSTVKSVLKFSGTILDDENKFKRKKNVAFSSSLLERNSNKKICTVNTDQSLENLKDYNFNQFNQLQSTYSQGRNVKCNVSDKSKEKLLNLLKNSIHKSVKIPQAVIRKFPGPAGLLPDEVGEAEVIDLNSVDENKNNSYNHIDVCSQNTKNLFSTGAWQLMIDDLPSNFNLYDIATIKENAFEYSKTYKKVPYLAGIVQYIDYKPNDPHIILKDLNGKIDAHIHHSICKMYPNALGTGIVILIKDVGLIVTSKKYVCLIISLKNLVSIYSDDVRLVETNNLQELLDSNYSCKILESQESICNEDMNKQNSIQKLNICNFEKNISRIDSSNNSLNMNSYKKSYKIVSKFYSSAQSNLYKQCKEKYNVDNKTEFDLSKDDSSWIAVDINDFNSLESHLFSSSTLMDVDADSEKNGFVDTKECENTSGNLKKYTSQEKARSSINMTNLERNDLIISTENTFKDVSVYENIAPQSKENSNNKLGYEIKSNKHGLNCESLNNSTKMKLAHFCSEYELIPEFSGLTSDGNNLIHLEKNKKCEKQNIKNETLTNTLFNCNDADDEMFSQLDVDAIVASSHE